MVYDKNQLLGFDRVKINEILANLSGWKVTGFISDAVYVTKLESGMTERLIDYCGSYSDLMPIAASNCARFEKVGSVWVVDSNPDGIHCWRVEHSDFMLAAAICSILQIQGSLQ